MYIHTPAPERYKFILILLMCKFPTLSSIFILYHIVSYPIVSQSYTEHFFFFSIRNLVCVQLNFLSVQVSKPRLRCTAQCSASISLLMLPSHYFFFCFTKKSIYAIGIYWVFVFFIVCLLWFSECFVEGAAGESTARGH